MTIEANETSKSEASIFSLNFPPAIEAAFQDHYYCRALPTLRASIGLMAGLGVLWALFASAQSSACFLAGTELLLFSVIAILDLLLLAVAFREEFSRSWQPLLVLTTLFSLMAPLLAASRATSPSSFLYLLLVASRIQRLQFRWMALELLGILGIIAWSIHIDAFGHWLGVSISIGHTSGDGGWQLVVVLLVLAATLMSGPLLWSFKSERFERKEFLSKYLLSRERDDERQMREQTEKMLHILSQSIGGIVHDLGNPLTAVQGGAETLSYYLEDGDLDKDTIREFLAMIVGGARLLNYLRLSLIEQTRVLEGRPVPLEQAPVAIRHLVKSGVQYQKPLFAQGRNISLDGPDLQICVDEMRFITVLMNLIGNALKYSDGEVRIVWHQGEDILLIAVQDQGRRGQGISEPEASELFSPFCRLGAHSQIEGTGLGLLSVRNIVEAHGGEIYIEGYVTGERNAKKFCTALGENPTALGEGFCSAFVVAIPI